jgi:hypothetical protein
MAARRRVALTCQAAIVREVWRQIRAPSAGTGTSPTTALSQAAGWFQQLH